MVGENGDTSSPLIAFDRVDSGRLLMAVERVDSSSPRLSRSSGPSLWPVAMSDKLLNLSIVFTLTVVWFRQVFELTQRIIAPYALSRQFPLHEVTRQRVHRSSLQMTRRTTLMRSAKFLTEKCEPSIDLMQSLGFPGGVVGSICTWT